MLLNFILAIFLSALISYLLTPKVRNFFISQGFVEDPLVKNKKTGNATALKPVPRGGGLPIFLAILVTSLIFLPLDHHLLTILAAAFFTVVIGLIDDIKDISPHFRLFCNFLAAVAIVSAGIGINYISNPFGGVINLSFLPASLLAIFWIVWSTNTVGWAAGVEGQLPGFVAISAIFIGILGLRYAVDTLQWPVIILAGAVAGSYLGFLPFNFSPQSIMPGYSAKSLAGFFLSLLSILSGAKLATLIFLLGIPMIDAFLVIIRRLFRHQSIFVSDGSHFHHQLLKLGWSRSQIAIFYWAVTLALGLLSLFLNSQQKFYTLFGLFLILSALITTVSRRTL
ncbi:undecaprenyl/decaprenyl-phosphate alpha-N-acetylglucosaminyl 1-phosphate transferase [Patescibacteria group bacterium]|nr:undecaprenyl/decaprenyl-phosphate alpha-N-acetylglucosaminyl 1-phosphate transferase [Patescibacteria group bacterium]